MTPKDKSIELKNRYYAIHYMSEEMAKQCAIIAVDEILAEYNKIIPRFLSVKKEFPQLKYWKEVKQEINNL